MRVGTTGATGATIPSFSLASPTGKTVSSWDYKARSNLVIFFVPNIHESGCREVLRQFASRYGEYRNRTSDVVAISQSDPAEVALLTTTLQLPFPVLIDTIGDTRHRYNALIGNIQPGPAIFISDRFGQVWAYSTGKTCQEMFSQDEILHWLDFIEIQCPE